MNINANMIGTSRATERPRCKQHYPETDIESVHQLRELRFDYVDSRGRMRFNFANSDPRRTGRVESRDSTLLRELNEQILRNENSTFEPKLKYEPVLGDRLKLSPLWIAVLRHCQNSAELLVRSGADVNEPFGCEVSMNLRPDSMLNFGLPLIDETSSLIHLLLLMHPSAENERLIRLMMDHGANLQTRDFYGRNALHCAVDRGRVELAELLLERGVEVNVADDYGRTALGYATSSREVCQLVPLLLKHGADVTAKCNQGQNALHHLAQVRDVKHADLARVARILIEKGASLHDRDFDEWYQPVHDAALTGNDELMQLYLDHGAELDAQTKEGESPLHLAVGQCKVLKTLLARGANVHLKSEPKGRTALHEACQMDCEESIGLLLSAGANVLAEDSNGNIPFALISRKCKNKANPNVRLMIKLLALNKVRLQPSIELKHESLIEKYPGLWDHYQDCIEHIYRMRFTRFTKSCTFFELIVKNSFQIAKLMRNPDFEANFGLYDLSKFSMYAEDVRRAFERAQACYRSMLELEDVINEALYYVLPDLVVRKVVGYIFS